MAFTSPARDEAREAERAAKEGGGPSTVRDEMRWLGSTVAAITDDLFGLVAKERRLAQAEMADSMFAARRAAIYGGVAAVLGLLVLGFLALSLMYGLDIFMPRWLAALATAGVIALGGGVLGWMAKSALADFTVMPKRTANSVKEDLRWASAQIRRSGTSPSSESASAGGSRS